MKTCKSLRSFHTALPPPQSAPILQSRQPSSASLEDLVQIGQVRHLNDISLRQETLRRKKVLPDRWEDDMLDLVEF